MYRIDHLTVPCPAHQNFNRKLKHFVHAADADAGVSAIALPVHLYRQAKNGRNAPLESPLSRLTLNLTSVLCNTA